MKYIKKIIVVIFIGYHNIEIEFFLKYYQKKFIKYILQYFFDKKNYIIFIKDK
jgi:hypothetical protein